MSSKEYEFCGQNLLNIHNYVNKNGLPLPSVKIPFVIRKFLISQSKETKGKNDNKIVGHSSFP